MAEIDDDELRELHAAAARADDAERRLAREQALREHPGLTSAMLEHLQGTPAEILRFATTLDTEIQSRQAAITPPLVEPPAAPAPASPPSSAVADTPAGAPAGIPPGYQLVPIGPIGEPAGTPAPVAPIVPTPSPGPGQAVSGDAEAQARKGELRSKLFSKTATQEEAQELAGLDMMRALTEIGSRRAHA